jgi:hypothetical protein
MWAVREMCVGVMAARPREYYIPAPKENCVLNVCNMDRPSQ